MRIDASHAATGGRSQQTSNDIMSRPAPAHVDTLRWNLADASERQQLLTKSPQQQPKTAEPSAWSAGGIVFGTGQGSSDAGRWLTQRGAQHTARGQDQLARSAEIFQKYPAQFSQQWDFTRSAVNGNGGASGPLMRYMDSHGIQHNGKAPNAPPAGSVANAQQASRIGVPANQINNHNGTVAENAIAQRLRAQGYTVQQNAMVDTPLGKRDVDVLATKNVGHPTLSEEIRVESKAGGGSPTRPLERVAKGSNNRAQIDKDASVLAEHKAKAPAAQAQGRQLHTQGTEAIDRGSELAKAGKAARVVGKIARPIGVVASAFEIGSAYKADGNKVGLNTAGKVASLAGGAGGAWAGAAAGAAIGSVVPGVGTVIGGVVGGIAGGLLGEAAVSGAFESVKGWFK